MASRRRVRLGVGLLLLWLVAVPTRAEPPVIRIAGSGTLEPVLERLTRAFEAESGEVAFSIEGRGSATGPPALLSGRVDLAALSRPLHPAELRAFERRFGAAPRAHPFAFDAVVIWVHESNPLDRISLPEVDAVFSTSRLCGAPVPVRVWGDLGLLGSWHARRIVVVGRNTRSGTRAYFREAALCGGAWRDDVRMRPGTESVRMFVAESPTAIGYGSGAGLAPGVKVLALAPSAGAPPVRPDAEAVTQGRYPLLRSLVLYSSPESEPEGVLARFLDFVNSEAAAREIRAAGLIPRADGS